MAKLPSDLAVPPADPLAGPSPEPASGGIVRLAVLDGGTCHQSEGEAALAELPKALSRRSAKIWVDVTGAGPELKGRVSGILKLHPLLVERSEEHTSELQSRQ